MIESSLKSSGVDQAKQEIDLQWILNLPCVEFIKEAYRSLLCREPDTDGLKHYATRMVMGRNRLLVLAEMRTSAEGQSCAQCVRSSELDSIVSRYRIVRKLPLGRWRWFLLPRYKQHKNDVRFEWSNYINYISKNAIDPSLNSVEVRLSKMECALNLVSEMADKMLQIKTHNVGGGFGVDVDKILVEDLINVTKTLNDLESCKSNDFVVSWEARAVYKRLLRVTR